MKIALDIHKCTECPFMKRVRTSGAGYAEDYHCSKMSDKLIVGYVEWASEVPPVPDWCPCKIESTNQPNRYINVSKLTNYACEAEAKVGPVSDKVSFVLFPYKHIDEIPTAEEDIIEQIASYFERTENWSKLKNSWLENGRAIEFRQLLKRALEV